jgi:hypothetical protein
VRGAISLWQGHRTARVLGFCLALVVLAVALRFLYGPGDVGYDARYSLVWGRELAHLQSPDHAAALSPTSHPLANAIGLVASLFGAIGPTFLVWLSFLAFAGLGVAAFMVGRRSFGTVCGVAFAAILLTRPLLVGEMLDASIDIPFLALVLFALALALRRRDGPALVALALAGLLRPEAWLLSIAYAAFALLASPRVQSGRIVALALSGPVIWLAFDAVTTGHPLQSLTMTQDLAGTLGRERGLSSAISDIPVNLQAIVGSQVAWVGIAGGAVMLFLAQDRARLPLAVLALGLLGFITLGVADLPLLTRYLLIPSAMLALLCGAALGAFEWLPAGRPRLAGVAVGAATVIALATSVSVARDGIQLNRDRVASDRAIEHGLSRVADAARSDGLMHGCTPVQAMTHRAIPLLAYRLHVRPSQVHVVLPSDARRGIVFSGPPTTLISDVGLSPGVTVRSKQLEPPRTFTRVGSNPEWTVSARCPTS